MWYEGAGTSDRRWLHADERGSVVAVSDGAGAAIAGGIHAYDEYGIPGGFYTSRFQYTGQAWIPEIGMYHYKARAYSPTLGRFMQTDPIGYGDGLNLYAYVGNDPVNRVDPSGLAGCRGRPTSTFIGDVEVITVTGCGEKGGGVGSTTGPTRIVGGGAVNGGGGGGGGVGPSADGDVEEVVVTGISGNQPKPSKSAQHHCYEACYPILERWQPPGSDRNQTDFNNCLKICFAEYEKQKKKNQYTPIPDTKRSLYGIRIRGHGGSGGPRFRQEGRRETRRLRNSLSFSVIQMHWRFSSE